MKAKIEYYVTRAALFIALFVGMRSTYELHKLKSSMVVVNLDEKGQPAGPPTGNHGPHKLGTLFPNASSVDVAVSNSLQVGSNVASTGAIRLGNNENIYGRNAANSADVQIAGLDNSNRVLVGYPGAGQVLINGSSSIQMYTGQILVGNSGNYAATGVLAMSNNTTMSSRNAGNTADIPLIGADTNNVVAFGSTGNSTLNTKDSFSFNGSSAAATMLLENGNAAGYTGIEYADNTGAVKVFTGYSNAATNHFRFNALGVPIRFMNNGTTYVTFNTNGQTTFAASITYAVRTVTTATDTIAVTDTILFINRAGAVTETLPAAPTAGDCYRIKDISGNASVNNITVSAGVNTIDGAASKVISSNYGSIDVCANSATAWSIL